MKSSVSENQNSNGRQDRAINSIKTNLPIFKGGSDPKAYLKWESTCERIF